MLGQDFPVAAYYKGNIAEAITINRSGSWWTAVLIIKHPTTGKKFLGLYKWQLRNGEWKQHQKLQINSQKDALELGQALMKLGSLIS